MKDYAKIKAFAQSILECIGDEDEGKSPDLPKQENDFNDGGQDSLTDLNPLKDGDTGLSSDKKKKKHDSSLAMMGSMLASKIGK